MVLLCGSEKARLLAEGNAAMEARKAEAEAEAKRKRDLEREKARQALQEASELHYWLEEFLVSSC